MRDHNSPVDVFWPVDYCQALAVKEALEESGVPCYIDGDSDAASFYMGLYSNSGNYNLRVVVRARDQDRALKFIRSRQWPSFDE